MENEQVNILTYVDNVILIPEKEDACWVHLTELQKHYVEIQY